MQAGRLWGARPSSRSAHAWVEHLEDLDFNVDTVDVFTISLGGLLGLMLLPADPSAWLEEVVICTCVLVFISIKRFFLPTPAERPNTTVGMRMLFLFLSIIGTGCTFGAIALGIYDVPELEQPSPGWPEGRLQLVLLSSGLGLLATSVILDRWLLKRTH